MAFINLANLAMGILAILSVLYNWRIALKIMVCLLACAMFVALLYLISTTTRGVQLKYDGNRIKERIITTAVMESEARATASSFFAEDLKEARKNHLVYEALCIGAPTLRIMSPADAA
uniref:ABC transmembrane type-1 domain-containing protein n=1 Tax=Macrostomum lignano TaxID=282301 RepID=A0A1I8GQT2_9PLAT